MRVLSSLIAEGQGNTLLQKSTCATARRKPGRVTFRPTMNRLALVFVLVLAASAAFGQGKRQESSQRMSQEERQRMRDDVRDAYRQRKDQRQERPQKARQQMSPEERGKL